MTIFRLLVLQIAEKQKYAVWKAADIRAALRDGRKPMAGPPGGDGAIEQDDLSVGWFPGYFWLEGVKTGSLMPFSVMGILLISGPICQRLLSELCLIPAEQPDPTST